MQRIALWRARSEAHTYLRRWRGDLTQLVDELLVLVDDTIDAYEVSAGVSTYARICGLTLLKAKNLAIGAYSLILDGLGQEAGALMRPFIEYAELITYLKRFPEEAETAASGKGLPRAGERAKVIGSIYREFREHLNQHAAHSSYSSYSLSHLLEPGSLRFKKLQHMVPRVLDRNMLDLAVQLYLLLHEGVLGLEPIAMTDLRRIGVHVDELHSRLVSLEQVLRS